MNDTELAATIDTQLASATGGSVDSEGNSDRAYALDRYYGKLYGYEEDGCSSVVTSEVFDTIEWMMPSLLRVFVSGERVVEFKATGGKDDEDQATEEADIVNDVMLEDNEGYLIFHDWFKDALLQKNGYIKISWEEEETVTSETYEGLTDLDLVEAYDMEEAGEFEIVGHAESEIAQIVNTPLGPQEQIVLIHDIKVEIKKAKGGVKIENLPPEEVRVTETARSISLDKASFVAHETGITVTDLLNRGISQEVIDTLPNWNDLDSELSTSRDEHSESESNEETDNSMTLKAVSECYLWIDYDGDGRAEYRKILKSGKEILENEELDYCPIVAITPIRMPHKHEGMSFADPVAEIQKIMTTLLRGMMDNLYLTNNPEKEVVEENIIDMDELLTSLPGGLKRVTHAGSITPLTVPFTAGASIPVMEMVKGMQQTRTGISEHTMGLDANALAQSTKGAFMGALEQANQRIEAVARLFAETGVKDLFKKIHSLLRKHQEDAIELKVRNKWIKSTPSEWKDRPRIKVTVGLGTGNKDALMQRLLSIAEKQEQHLIQGSPIVTPTNIYNTYAKLVETADMGDVNQFFTDPSQIPPKQPQPDPNIEIVKAQLQLQKEQLDLSKQGQLIKAQFDKMEADRKRESDEHKQLMDEMKEATARSKLELENGVNVPGAAV